MKKILNYIKLVAKQLGLNEKWDWYLVKYENVFYLTDKEPKKDYEYMGTINEYGLDDNEKFSDDPEEHDYIQLDNGDYLNKDDGDTELVAIPEHFLKPLLKKLGGKEYVNN